MTKALLDEPTDAMIEAASEAIYNFLDERFPEGAMPGGQQLFADDHLDAEFKHEAGCDALAIVALNAALRSSAPQEPVVATGANGQAVEILEIGGRNVEVDAEIAPIVEALNAAGVATRASCSGHGHRPATIILQDGREIHIARNYAEGRRIGALFPININGDPVVDDDALKPLDDILRDWTDGTMDAAGTIEDLISHIDRLQAKAPETGEE